MEYFLRSTEKINQQKMSTAKTQMSTGSSKEAPPFDFSKGIGAEVTLPDGSFVYKKEFIENNTPPKVSVGGSTYKIKPGSQISEEAVDLFSKLIRRMNMIGINTVLFMAPYHPNVWTDKTSTEALIEVEERVRKLGKDLNIKVLGSYNPDNIRCNPDEFYDDMHARDSCLSKITN